MCLKLLLLLLFSLASANLHEVFRWKQVNFKWPNKTIKHHAIARGEYKPINNIPCAIERWRNKLFVTFPRYKHGVAAALTFISLEKSIPLSSAPLLEPYPDWQSNYLKNHRENETLLLSVFRVKADVCDRLWVFDQGEINIMEGKKRIRPPTLLIFDLITNKLIRKKELENIQYYDNSYFENIVVDVSEDNCDDAFAYISDLGGYSLVIYSYKKNEFWKTEHDYFHIDPLQGVISVGGIEHMYKNGIYGMALGTIQNDGFRKLYFHPLASTTEFEVSTMVLRNKTLVQGIHSYKFYKVLGVKGNHTQSTSSVFDPRTDILFQTQLGKSGIACWNVKAKLNPDNFHLIIKDDKKLVYPSHMLIDNERNIWILSNKVSILLIDGIDPNDYKYRILKIPVKKAIRYSKCI